MKPEIIRIALIGPESTGKTTLCMNLAKHYHTVWVPEYSRDYIAGLGRPYTNEDIIYCLKKQLEDEAEKISVANKILFSDSEILNYHVWMLDVFNRSPQWVNDKIIEDEYDLYLLTKADIPFVDDPVRENPHRREYFYDWYKSELKKRNFNFEIVEGTGHQRLSNAIEIIEKHFLISI